MYKNLIFDMDDTLIHCGKYYIEAKNKFINFQHKRTKLPIDIITKLINDLDVTCTSLPDGFNKERLPRSFAATSTVLDIIRGMAIDETAKVKSALIGSSVFNAEYEPFEGVFETLQMYKDAGFNLFLNTKGDSSIQQMKIDKHNLQRYFEPDHIYIVPKKDKWCVFRILQEHNLEIKETLSIGDSLRDDVGTAKELGVHTVLISEANHTWEYENTDHEPTYELRSVTDLPMIVSINPSPFTVSLEEARISFMDLPKWKRDEIRARIDQPHYRPNYDVPG